MPRWLEHRIPPPVIDALCAALMWLASEALPQAQVWARGSWPWAVGLGVSAALAGGLIALAGVREFAHARTTVNPLKPERASAMVTGGVFRFTRNPMYLGMLLVLAGWALWLGNAAAFAGLPLSMLVLNALQIGPEERILRERFGDEWTRYAARVRRWV